MRTTGRGSRAAAWVAGVVLLALGALVLVPGASSGRGGHFTVGAEDDNTTPFNLVSMPALIAHHYTGRDFRLVRSEGSDLVARRWQISYRGDGLRLSGTLAVPRSAGAHPLVVTTHGWIRPYAYRNGVGLEREERRLVRLGFAVLHPDYRNYGGSQYQSARPVRSPLGYPADVLNAVVALKRAHLPRVARVDTRHIALFGRSMGGGVALQAAVARPHWFDALVLYSAVSSDAAENYHRWVLRDPSLRVRVRRAYGDPSSNPEFWAQASSRNYLSRLGSMPVQLHHGTDDHMCPEYWSLETYGAMKKVDVSATLSTYAGEHHRFSFEWRTFMHRADGFLLAHDR